MSADTYKITATKLNVRDGKSTDSGTTKTLAKGAEVKIYAKESGKNNKQWGAINKEKTQWVSMEYVKKIASGDKKTKKDRSSSSSSPSKENKQTAKDNTVYGNDNAAYEKVLKKSIRAFGSPPRYIKDVDPYYDTKGFLGTGRAMGLTWYSDPAILSICPGKVDYLPGFTKKKKNEFFNMVKGAMSKDVLALATRDRDRDLNGQLYAFKSAYTNYMNVVNMLARTASIFLGIGDETDIIPGTKLKLKDFDYGWYTTPSKAKSKGLSGVFEETKHALNTVVTDDSYIHFFVNHSGAQVSESFSTEAGKSYIEEQLVGSGTGLDSLARNIQFLFGGAIGGTAKKDLEAILKEARDSNELLGGFATISSNYLKGGRLVFPQMITGMGYDKSVSVELNFTSVYGDKRSIFKYVILPCLHLLALAVPKQLSSNMYTYPYLVRCYQRGVVNIDLGYIRNLEFSRGGSDNACWTVDGLPTEITARFSIVPLYSNMMVTSSKNPFLAMQNTALLEYLGTMTGLDLKENVLNRKVEVAKSLLKNRVHDIPTNWARGFTDTKLINGVRDFFTLTG